MPKKTIRAEKLQGVIEYEDEVEFVSDCIVDGDLTAPSITAIGQLQITGTLRCENLQHPPEKPPICGKMYVGGEYRGGSDEVEAPVTSDPSNDWPDHDVTVDPVLQALEEKQGDESVVPSEEEEDVPPVDVKAEKDLVRSPASGNNVAIDLLRNAVMNKKIVAVELAQVSNGTKNIQYLVLEDNTKIGVAMGRVDHAGGGILEYFKAANYNPDDYTTYHVCDADKLSDEDRKNVDIAHFAVFEKLR